MQILQTAHSLLGTELQRLTDRLPRRNGGGAVDLVLQSVTTNGVGVSNRLTAFSGVDDQRHFAMLARQATSTRAHLGGADAGSIVDEQFALIKQKRNQLENLISSNAVIYQVYDNDTYGIERLDKQKYITLVTTPTTSLKNLNVIEMKNDIKGKIVSIKFKIATTNENNK